MPPAKRIIPCLDVDGGKVVKGVRFRSLKSIGDPAALASAYEEQGADEVVFLDIAATVAGRRRLLAAVKGVAERLTIPLTVGGGIRTIADVRATLNSGADKVAINTAAIEHPALITRAADEFGSQCVVVAVDAGRVDGKHLVFTRSATRPTGLDAVRWARKAAALGAGEILLTSIDADGTQDGYDIALTRRVAEAVRVPVVASGGAGSMKHFLDAFTKGGASAALLASLLHYGQTTVGAVKEYLRRNGVEVR